MPGLPTGTITFLFTDVVGSTRLWEQYPEAMRLATERHDRLVEASVARYGGELVRPRGEGDSRFAVFVRASGAVAAACDLQLALQAEAWLESAALAVRVAIHTGEADLRDGDYYGVAVNRCARLRGIAHGGQVLISGIAVDLARGSLPAEVTFRDLGYHRLVDLLEPEHVFQLVHPQLSAEFPPLLSLDAHAHNLPVETGALIGRERDIASIHGRLDNARVRVLTITGAGGTGKTRVALHVAAERLDRYTDGVFFVTLGALSDSDRVVLTIAQALSVREQPGTPLLAHLTGYLRKKHMLLLLDNFEQVLPAAPYVSDLLAACPRLSVLVTSRARLRLYGEHEIPLQPLPTASGLRLFADRARAVAPQFALNDQTAPVVAEICQRLDGLPLAIELAAARVKLLPPAAMSARLEHRLGFLVGGPQDRPERQQTVRATLEWSYRLLDATQQALFRRLGVFAGGCTVEAAEAVCAAGDGGLPNVLDGLTALIDWSLLRQDDTDAAIPRVRMLETIREYALEQLELTAEVESTRRAHVDYFVALGEEAAPELNAGPEHARWIQRLQKDQDNLRIALRWCVENGEVERGLRLGGSVWRYWFLRGSPSEGRDWLHALLALVGTTEFPALRARALTGAGVLAVRDFDFDAAQALHEEALAIGRTLDDSARIAASLHNLGAVQAYRREYACARALIEEAAAMSRAAGDLRRVIVSMHLVSAVLGQQGDFSTARERLVEAQIASRELHDMAGLASSLAREGFVACIQCDFEAAKTLCETGLQLARETGDQPTIRWACTDLGLVRLHQRDYAALRDLCVEVLPQQNDTHAGLDTTATCLQLVAAVAAENGQVDRAIQLFGAADAIWSTTPQLFPLIQYYLRDRWLLPLRSRLDEEAFQANLAAGRDMGQDHAIAIALETIESCSSRSPATVTHLTYSSTAE